MKNKNYLLIPILCVFSVCLKAGETNILSPDKKLKLSVITGENLSFRLFSTDKLLMEANNIQLDTDRGIIPAKDSKVSKTKKESVDRFVVPVIKEKQAKIPEVYNEYTLEFKDKSKLQIRLYNNGFAYRYILNFPGEITIWKDNADFIFPENSQLIFQKDTKGNNSDYESPYVTARLDTLKNNDMGNLPALVRNPDGKSILFLEADTKDYPCMWIKKTSTSLSSHFWGYPAEYNSKGNQKNRRVVTKNMDYIAKTQGTRNFPWKIFGISDKDTDLLENQLVYLLGEECKIQDPSWIKPGWVTFDWWARRGLYNVDFKAGINTATAKYMIDFAADFGIRYFLFDDGWTYKEDLTRTIDGLDIKEVVRHANSKNVDVMLWVTFDLFDSQMEAALKQFSEWGIKGVKIDFINRSDQEASRFYWRAAEQCAKYKMVIDFHGAYRPDGLRRAYPNVLTREALIEFEYNGGTNFDTPEHHCTLPFIRNVAGPIDYIPGTMNNGTKRSFRMNGDTPMGQGTRAHSLALAVITESPMQMLSDPQPDYYREKECTEFLTQVPVEWDQIVPLNGQIGKYVSMARRNNNNWYVASITDWTPRKMTLNFDFLTEGQSYTMVIFKDGINADIRAIDYIKETRNIKKGDTIEIDLAPGGGWVAGIYPVK